MYPSGSSMLPGADWTASCYKASTLGDAEVLQLPIFLGMSIRKFRTVLRSGSSVVLCRPACTPSHLCPTVLLICQHAYIYVFLGPLPTVWSNPFASPRKNIPADALFTCRVFPSCHPFIQRCRCQKAITTNCFLTCGTQHTCVDVSRCLTSCSFFAPLLRTW